MKIDTTTDFGQRAARRLREAHIIWLTTVRRDGTPQPSPVWFLWDGETILIFSQPNTQKLRNIRHNPSVSLHFDGNGQGGDIVILIGKAEIAEDAPLASAIPDYVTKYAEGIKRMGVSPESMARSFSTAIRITPTDLRGH